MRQDVVAHYVQEMHIHAACPFLSGLNEFETLYRIFLEVRCACYYADGALAHFNETPICSGIRRKTSYKNAIKFLLSQLREKVAARTMSTSIRHSETRSVPGEHVDGIGPGSPRACWAR